MTFQCPKFARANVSVKNKNTEFHNQDWSSTLKNLFAVPSVPEEYKELAFDLRTLFAIPSEEDWSIDLKNLFSPPLKPKDLTNKILGSDLRKLFFIPDESKKFENWGFDLRTLFALPDDTDWGFDLRTLFALPDDTDWALSFVRLYAIPAMKPFYELDFDDLWAGVALNGNSSNFAEDESFSDEEEFEADFSIPCNLVRPPKMSKKIRKGRSSKKSFSVRRSLKLLKAILRGGSYKSRSINFGSYGPFGLEY